MSAHRHRGGRANWKIIAGLVGTGLVGVGIIVGAAAWRDLTSARAQLVSAKRSLAQTLANSSGLETNAGRAGATAEIDQAAVEVASARRTLQTSLALDVARFLPDATRQRQGLLQLVDDSQVALSVGRGLVTQIDGLVAHGHVIGARVPLDSLVRFEDAIRSAAAQVARLERSSSGLWGPIGAARSDFDRLAGSTSTRLAQDADALRVADGIMGSRGARHYFVALENNAEMRDQGMVLEYALVTFDLGQLHVDRQGSISSPVTSHGAPSGASLSLKAPAPIQIPAGTAAVFGDIRPNQLWQSVNATADFGWSGRAMQAMYQQATGQTVDGVIALDVPALSALLDAVGQVTVPGVGESVTSSNAGTVLLHDLYDSVPRSQQVVRRALLADVATDVIAKLKVGSFDPVPLAQRLASAAAGGHLKVWSADPSEERTLEANALGGGPATSSADRTFHIAVENRNATKMDYYIRSSVTQQVLVTRNGTAIVRTTVIVRNTAPLGARPSYQLGPDGYSTTAPGEYWAWVLMWGPAGASQPGAVEESGLNLSQAILAKIFAGQTQQVTFDTIIPNAVRAGLLQLRYVPQPRLVAPTLDVAVQADGWTVAGSARWAGPWVKTMTLDWALHH